ncbi:MAG TPA: SURF1 family protein [Burkholderiaceae bacterium]|jgi:surfeit locus 1 family protein|nr:SURF1 family protein [Burkholderiaceae bacterium]
MKPATAGGKPVEPTRSAGFQEIALRRTRAAHYLLIAGVGLIFLVLLALGTWQVKRLFWKLDLIERVEQRVHAQAQSAPGPERWQQISAASDEYRHVSVTGTFLYPLTTRTQASTELGTGFWLLTPLREADGSIVLVNRGFVASQAPKQALDSTPSESPVVTVTGLLRISEPHGSLLRHNDPVNNHWYSRDVQAIATARGLHNVAPYFVDADAGESTIGAPDHPVGGLTVIAFPNNHLVYAITWYALALMLAGAIWWIVRGERNRSRDTIDEDQLADLKSDNAEQR